ncbi:MAG: hypothetical protein Q9205_006795 [Flavoplaca limonia]
MTQTSSTGSTLVCFYLQPQPFPNVPTIEHVAFCWHHKFLSPGNPQYVILARPGGITPFPTIRPPDLGSLIYHWWDSTHHCDLYTIDCQGSSSVTYFDYTALCWRRLRRDFPRGPAGSIVAFPVETFATRIVTFIDSAKTKPGKMILPGNLAGDKEVREAALILLAMKHSTEGKSGAPACGTEASVGATVVQQLGATIDTDSLINYGSSSKADDKQSGLQHSERVDEEVYEAVKIFTRNEALDGRIGWRTCESSSEENEKQLDFNPNGLADEEEKENRAFIVPEQEHNRKKAGTVNDDSAKSDTARAVEEERSLEFAFTQWLGA